MLAILEDIDEEDHFALIQFDDRIEPWRESLSKATKENVAEGMDYVRNISDRGG